MIKPIKKGIFLLVFLLNANFISTAQVPGYMGKRFSVSANFSFFPTIIGPTADNLGPQHYGSKGGGFAFDTKYGGQLNYVVGRRKELFLAADFYKTGMISTYKNNYESVFGNHDEYYCFHNLNVTSLNIGMKFYPSNTLAPLGFSYGISLGYNIVNGEILDYQKTGSRPAWTEQPLIINQKKSFISAGLELGWNHILFDRLVLNVGVKSNFDIISVLGVLAQSSRGSSDYIEPQQDYDTNMKSRLLFHNIFMINIGVGCLIF
jgi:hypothetical protein